MNKYQEALNRINTHFILIPITLNFMQEDIKLLQELIDNNKKFKDRLITEKAFTIKRRNPDNTKRLSGIIEGKIYGLQFALDLIEKDSNEI